MTITSIQQLAVEAKAVIVRDGWSQSGMLTADGRVCILGARDMALFGRVGSVPDNPLRFDFNRVAFAILGTEVTSLSTWNDAPERTVNDVLDLLDTIAGLSDDEIHAKILEHSIQ